MKIKHFIYGKFSSLLPDFGVRISDSESFDKKGVNGFSAIANYFQNNFRSIFYTNSFPEFNPEIIVRIKDKYIYARFYPPFNEQRGTAIECVFHAFVFSKKDMGLINYCPLSLKQNFIKEFNHSGIMAYSE